MWAASGWPDRCAGPASRESPPPQRYHHQEESRAAISTGSSWGRSFTATRPDQIWTPDITYIPTGAGFLYLAAVIYIWFWRLVGLQQSVSLPGHSQLRLLVSTGRDA